VDEEAIARAGLQSQRNFKKVINNIPDFGS
jgi:hypothetical protein